MTAQRLDIVRGRRTFRRKSQGMSRPDDRYLRKVKSETSL